MATNAKRIMKDIESVNFNMEHWNNTQYYYYVADENNMNKGIIMIMGVENSPYYGGFYFFENTFPHDYPFSPPVWKFLSNDDKTRFNPNLYRSAHGGKVCLSILNTWGESTWSQIRRLSSVIEEVRAHLFHDKPLINEPGYSDKDPMNDIYYRMIQYENLNFNIYSNIVHTPDYAKQFLNIMKENFIKNKDFLQKYINDTINMHNQTDTIKYDNQKITYNYNKLQSKYSEILSICES